MLAMKRSPWYKTKTKTLFYYFLRQVDHMQAEPVTDSPLVIKKAECLGRHMKAMKRSASL
jgi:hypothetical protein